MIIKPTGTRICIWASTQTVKSFDHFTYCTLMFLCYCHQVPVTCSFMWATSFVRCSNLIPQNQVHLKLQINFTHIHIYVSFSFSSLNQWQYIYKMICFFFPVNIKKQPWCRMWRYFLTKKISTTIYHKMWSHSLSPLSAELTCDISQDVVAQHETCQQPLTFIGWAHLHITYFEHFVSTFRKLHVCQKTITWVRIYVCWIYICQELSALILDFLILTLTWVLVSNMHM
jgi:hypothetical protein